MLVLTFDLLFLAQLLAQLAHFRAPECVKSPKNVDMGSCRVASQALTHLDTPKGPRLSGLLHEGVLAVTWVGLKVRFTLWPFHEDNYAQHRSTFFRHI